MDKQEFNISPLIAARINGYEDKLYSLAVAGLAESIRIEILPDYHDLEAQLTTLPSEYLGLGGATDSAGCSEEERSLRTRLCISRVSLENIAAADTAVADPQFVNTCLRIRPEVVQPLPNRFPSL
jgi:hypothetical protein